MATTVVVKESAVRQWGKLALIGAVFGVAIWLLGLFIAVVIVDPLSCGITGDTTACVESIGVAGTISAIIVAAAAIFVGIRLGIARPMAVAISAGILLWGLSVWVDGLFWLEALGWSALLGTLGYLFFGWLNRYQSIAVTIIVTLLVLIFERIALSL